MSEERIYGPYYFETSVNQYNYLSMLKLFFDKHRDDLKTNIERKIKNINKKTVFENFDKDVNWLYPRKAVISKKKQIV